MGKVAKSLLIAAAIVAIGVATGGIGFLPAMTLPATGATIGGSIVVSSTLGAAMVAVATSVVLSGVSQQLFGPKMPKAQLGRLNATFETQASRKFVFGETAMNTDIRYYETSGTNQEYFDYIIATAAHEVESTDQIWFDDELAWSSSSGISQKYVGYLSVDYRNVGTSANTISINGGSIWGSSCRLTGCAYVHLRIKRTGNDSAVEGPLVNGLPSRLTIKGKGAKIYDPRLDSTVSGGAGSQRADDQTTWGSANSVNRENPALQLLWFMLGWRINGKLSVGCGVPHNRIDLESFITAANICDEPISLAAGGTQPRYRTAGVGSDSDSRMEIIQVLLSSMNATLRDSNGSLSLTVMKNDLAVPTLTFDDNDILGEFSWNQTRGLDEMMNAVHGKYTDPSNYSLYQPVEYPTVSIDSVDGIERMQTFDMPWVQDGNRAQRIAKQVLQRAQYKGIFSATFSMKALGCEVGDVVYISFTALGWTNKPFRIISQGINNSGQVPMTMIEENASIYAWDASERAVVTPTAPTVYDVLNNPLIIGVNDLANNKFITINADRLTFTFDGAGNLYPASQSSTVTVTPNNLTQGAVVWSYSDNLSTSSSTLAGLITVVGPNQITIPSTVFTGTPSRVWIKATVSGQGTENDILANVTIVKVVDGSTGSAGSDGISAYLTNEAILLFAYADGAISSYAAATGSFKLFKGTTDISSYFSLSTVNNPQTLSMVYSGQNYSVTGGFDTNEDTAQVTIRATGSGIYAGVTFDKILSLSKAKGGYEIVSTLPATNLFEGRVVFLTTDDKLYRYTGSTWTAAVPSTDISGTISNTQLAVNSVTADKISAGSITGAKLAAANVVTLSAQINDAIITTAKIGDLQVTTLKIGDYAVTVPVYAFTAASSLPPLNTWTQTQSLTTTVNGGIVALKFGSAIQVYTTDDNAYGRFRILRDGAVIAGPIDLPKASAWFFGTFQTGINQASCWAYIDTPASGTHTYSVEIFIGSTKTTSGVVSNRYLEAIELKK